jgi:hypothetical protein
MDLLRGCADNTQVFLSRAEKTDRDLNSQEGSGVARLQRPEADDLTPPFSWPLARETAPGTIQGDVVLGRALMIPSRTPLFQRPERLTIIVAGSQVTLSSLCQPFPHPKLLPTSHAVEDRRHKAPL